MKKIKNKILSIFVRSLLFCIVFSLLFKWWQTGNPFQISTILFGKTTFIILLASMAIWEVFFQKQMDIPIKHLRKRLLPLLILYLFIVLLVSFCIIGIDAYIYRLALGLNTADLWSFLIEEEYPGTLRMYWVLAVIVSAFFFYTNWGKAIDREQQLTEENLIYRYRTLKAQVNPHFLFNSLNTLSEIVYVDAQKADNYIQKLAGVYRYILDNEETDLISLEEEIKFVDLYFELQKVRDGDRIDLDIDFGQPKRFKIIPISLQILVENALKHNSASEDSPLQISIYNSEQEYIVVTNPIRKRSTLHSSHGMGLANLKERVKLIMGKEMIIEMENNQFKVKLPIMKA